jgi:hypothetical protein
MKRTLKYVTGQGLAAGLLIMGLAGMAVAEIEFTPLVDASMAITSGKFEADQTGNQVDSAGNTRNSNDASSSGDFYLSFAPNFRFTELPNLWITPYIECEYTGANNLLQIEDEAFVFAKRLYLYWVLGANYEFNRLWTLKAKGFGRMENDAETNDETLNNGLYSYRDAGGWMESSFRYWVMCSKFGYKAYMRRYPFYTNADFVTQYEQSVGPWPANVSRDLREKDINVNESWGRQEISWGSWPVLTNLEIRYREVNYTQMPSITEDGSFSADLRKDGYLEGILELPVQLHKYHQLELDYNYTLHVSNQNYYSNSEQYFIGGYYNYYQNNVRLLYNLTIPFKITGYMPKLSLSLSGQKRLYPGRPSRQKTSDNDTVGAYTSDPHWENTGDIGISLRQQLFAEWFNLFLSFHSITQTSNTNVSDNISYNFKYNTFTLGTAVSF